MCRFSQAETYVQLLVLQCAAINAQECVGTCTYVQAALLLAMYSQWLLALKNQCTLISELNCTMCMSWLPANVQYGGLRTPPMYWHGLAANVQ